MVVNLILFSTAVNPGTNFMENRAEMWLGASVDVGNAVSVKLNILVQFLCIFNKRCWHVGKLFFDIHVMCIVHCMHIHPNVKYRENYVIRRPKTLSIRSNYIQWSLGKANST